MDKDSAYLLQLIDCNCNNCTFMERDFETYEKWRQFHYDLCLAQFNDEKRLADPVTAANMKFQFEKRYLLNYGKCKKFQKSVSFIPDTCQLDTQDCFKHRK